MTEPSADAVLKNPPCFRTGLMWGIGVGSIIGLHRFRTTKRVRSSCDFAMGAFLVVAAGSWFVCSTAYRTRAKQTREFMEVMNNPERKAEAEQFLRSRVQTRPSDDEST
ncbi:hypothetical protein BBO99_00006901 [Phytophthora kernoviae]|uniref:Cytochrome c oxidase assembly protein COX20, mitochondrial n=2 Tax=Phytophthora kernoviae TaxID=325452 RepID=A0A3R7HFY5_9STRA|nr:hypothetical protein G195_007789 [Phytophthora kernoviae 00238/432]KAG2520540.1 hypothetical protein JM16_006684 [Phytophthora kernoviae]KAG2522229.1 hypothetical protein JM18_006267 [Phytophthora kernoviae]RLN44085.1 hypothetical protein BBI17_007001 [Phytophthora kernoviae]RLN77230.1 hypothetical protein BBO99_00006901 [Phytophthora kernoviae]